MAQQKFPVTGRYFLGQEEVFCKMKKFPVTETKIQSQEGNFPPIFKVVSQVNVDVDKNRFIITRKNILCKTKVLCNLWKILPILVITQLFGSGSKPRLFHVRF